MTTITDFINQARTEWVIAEAAKYGVSVTKRATAPNGGEVIYFDFCSNTDNGKKNPYFMIWTGDGTNNYPWHLEFGHWYFPKNYKERRKYPTTASYGDKQATLARMIKDYAERRGT